jgi:hypothetical protein
MLTTNDPNSADQKLAIVNPGKSQATRPSMAAFTTKRKRPRVRMVKGKVREITSGRKIAFTIPNSNAERARDPRPSMCIPGMIELASQRLSALISILSKNPRITPAA